MDDQQWIVTPTPVVPTEPTTPAPTPTPTPAPTDTTNVDDIKMPGEETPAPAPTV
jgi:hypothetical protein